MRNGRPVVVLVDDEPVNLQASRLILQSYGIEAEVVEFSDSRRLLPWLEENRAAAVVLDLFMPHLSGIDLLPQVTARFPGTPVIVMTAVGEAATAVECMKAGAFDYLVKPVEPGRLVMALRKALEIGDLALEVSSLRECLFTDRLQHPEVFAPIVSVSRKMGAIFQYLEVVGRSAQPVLVQGETGTGKELVARAIHDVSGRAGEFVAVNVAGVDDTVFSDTLFGHRKGAFTGADQAREGLVARAAGGTLFLDEIGDLGDSSQVKLLRLLQEREYYPVGSDVARRTDARVVCATNRDLRKAMAAGTFRHDLYYRLCAHQVQIPPLRERLDDIKVLLDHFLDEAAKAFQKKRPAYPPELVTLLSTYAFPGNIRELQAMVFDALARHSSHILSMESFREAVGEPSVPAATPTATGTTFLETLPTLPTLRELEDLAIDEALRRSRGNQGIAASLLGITRQTLNKRLRELRHD